MFFNNLKLHRPLTRRILQRSLHISSLCVCVCVLQFNFAQNNHLNSLITRPVEVALRRQMKRLKLCNKIRSQFIIDRMQYGRI